MAWVLHGYSIMQGDNVNHNAAQNSYLYRRSFRSEYDENWSTYPWPIILVDHLVGELVYFLAILEMGKKSLGNATGEPRLNDCPSFQVSQALPAVAMLLQSIYRMIQAPSCLGERLQLSFEGIQATMQLIP